MSRPEPGTRPSRFAATIQLLFVLLGLVSGYLEGIAPISNEALRLVPGGIAALSALIMLLLVRLGGQGQWVPPGRKRRVFWLLCASAVAVVAIVSLFRYLGDFDQSTVEVQTVRRVKGAVLTPEARDYLRHEGGALTDAELIGDRGGIDQVWEADSIRSTWWRLTRKYVICVVGSILALAFLVEALATPVLTKPATMSETRDQEGTSRIAPPKVFISYSRSDEDWKNRLVSHLGVLEAEGVLEVWDDERIVPGEDWRSAIETSMEGARVAVLLISVDFLNSSFIRNTEVPRFLARRRDGLLMIPLIVHPCPWEAVDWLAPLECWPRDRRPLSAGRRAQAEKDLAALALKIRDLLRTPPVAAPEPSTPA